MNFFYSFWRNHPALFYGCSFTLGISLPLIHSLWLIIPCLFLWLPFSLIPFSDNLKCKEPLIPFVLSILVFFMGWIYVSTQYSSPHLPSLGVIGKAHVKIKTIRLQPGFFGKRWIYYCKIEQFFPDNSSRSIATSLPCLIVLPVSEKKSRPIANREYWIEGKLVEKNQGSFLLKVSAKAEWMPIPNTWSQAESRYQWKKNVSEWIKSKYSHGTSATFLAGLATGEFDDLWMRQNFARFGLQHLLAISGFHFSIIAAFLSLILRLFFPIRSRIYLLLILLGSYCFFLGPQSSILRAWLMCSLALCGGLLEKQSTALNSLGLALIIILGYDPTLCLELGFQFSFATTVAILLLYSPAQDCLNHLFPKRRLSHLLKMNGWNQHGYCMLAFLRQGLALTLAVNAFAFPMTLYHFHKYPWMSLLYNLFYPFLAAGSLCLFLFGSLLSFIPFVSKWIHQVNDEYTYFLLQLTYQIPDSMDRILIINDLSSHGLILYLCIIFIWGIWWNERRNSEKTLSFI